MPTLDHKYDDTANIVVRLHNHQLVKLATIYDAGTGVHTLVTAGSSATGGATEAKQDTGNASIANIDTKLSAVAKSTDINEVVTRLDLSNTNEAAANALLQQIDTKLTEQVLTPTASTTDGQYPSVDGWLQCTYYSPDGDTGTFNTITVPAGFQWSSPAKIAALSINLASSGTGSWIAVTA